MLFRPGHIGAMPEVGGADPAGEGFLNSSRPIPMGMQKFLAKKGITSSDQLFDLMKFAPRIRFRRSR
ncbi:hypothetical protein JCM15765_27380 [Paradesulfitobacterium aromaticivorans]